MMICTLFLVIGCVRMSVACACFKMCISMYLVYMLCLLSALGVCWPLLGMCVYGVALLCVHC